jgi:hypothetical protein
MRILAESGEKIVIPKVPVGNMFQPDPEVFASVFLNRLGEGDIVLSPSGPNYTYLPGAYARGAKVYWIHPGNLKGVKKLAEHLLRLFKETPDEFYEYQPQDERIASLGLLTRAWLGLERQVTADENALSQLMRRERDFFSFHKPDREGWLRRSVESERRKFAKQLSGRGVKLTRKQQERLSAGILARAEELYASYFEPGVPEKQMKKARITLIREQLEWFGVAEKEAFYADEAWRALEGTPEKALFDGLIGEKAVKTRIQVLTYIRNPLFYPSAGHLRAYAGLGITDGQANRRRRGEASRGNPEFRRALCFDFADKYWSNDPIGYFKALYYAYKAHQYFIYWGLMELTRDVFQTLRMSEDETEEDAEEGGNGHDATSEAVRPLIHRLAELSHLDLIAKSAPVKEVIETLKRSPDPKLLRRLFSKSPRDGFNLQVTPKRVEAQVKRLLGVTLLDTIYYRWLASLGEPLPLAEDFIYLRRWRNVEGRTDGVPEAYDHQVVLRYFQMCVEELRASREPLPSEVELKLVPKEDRPTTVAT